MAGNEGELGEGGIWDVSLGNDNFFSNISETDTHYLTAFVEKQAKVPFLLRKQWHTPQHATFISQQR